MKRTPLRPDAEDNTTDVEVWSHPQDSSFRYVVLRAGYDSRLSYTLTDDDARALVALLIAEGFGP